jgi:hypothetical protein
MRGDIINAVLAPLGQTVRADLRARPNLLIPFQSFCDNHFAYDYLYQKRLAIFFYYFFNRIEIGNKLSV